MRWTRVIKDLDGVRVRRVFAWLPIWREADRVREYLWLEFLWVREVYETTPDGGCWRVVAWLSTPPVKDSP